MCESNMSTHAKVLLCLGFMTYRPKRVNLCLINNASDRGFVNMSAVLRVDATFWTLHVPCFTWSRKWWYLTAMCYVLGLYLLSSIASTRQLALSSQTGVGGTDLNAHVLAARLNLFSFGLIHFSIFVVFFCSSVIKVLIGIMSLMHVLSATYSFSVVKRVTPDCILLAHRREQFIYVSM